MTTAQLETIAKRLRRDYPRWAEPNRAGGGDRERYVKQLWSVCQNLNTVAQVVGVNKYAIKKLLGFESDGA